MVCIVSVKANFVVNQENVEHETLKGGSPEKLACFTLIRQQLSWKHLWDFMCSNGLYYDLYGIQEIQICIRVLEEDILYGLYAFM
jgi:hypothetical protein